MADIRDRGDGAYQLRVEAGYGRDGKPAYKYRTYKASPGMTKKQQEKEAQKQLLKFEEEVRTGQCVSSDMTFAEFTREWMENSDLRLTTRSGYITLLKRIIPAIGHIRLRDLQPKHLREFYKNLAEGGVRQDTKYELCADLKRELKKRGLTMQALSERSGVSLTTLRSSINGHNVRCDIAQKVNAVLKDDIFQPVGGKTVLSGKTQREHHHLISSILHTAVQWDMIPYNPCDRIVRRKRRING